MSVTVTRTKIIVPRRRPDLLSRSRLISSLDEVLDYPYTLISAPAGYGKTSLMIDLAHHADYPVCWYSIDPLDLDPNRFLAHFIHAIQIQFPEFGIAALSILGNQANPLQDTSQVISILVNEIYQKISEHFVIFLDDFHHVNSDQGICTFISRFGQKMDDNTHLVMASRTLFNFPDLTLLIGRRMVKGIGFDDLAFQPHEIKSYYREVLQREINDKETETILERTEGWITGLVFSVDTDLTNLPCTSKKDKITGVDLFRYLAEQVFEKQTSQVQDFLLRSSILDEFNADLCDQFLERPGSHGWAEMISNLQQKNLFLQQVEDENSWVRYHTLFRDFLRTRFHDLFPEKEQEILSRLFDIYLETESWEKAFAIAKQIERADLMAEVIEKSNPTLIHQGRMKLLSSWLDQLPEEGFEIYPNLYLLHGFVLTELGKPLEAQSKINYAIEYHFTNKAGFLINAYTWRATSSRLMGRYKDALEDGLLASKLSKNNTEKNPLLAETYREIGIAYSRLGNNLDAIKYLRLSLTEYQQSNKFRNAAQVQIDLGHAFMQAGNYRDAKYHFEASLTYWLPSNNKNKLSILNNNLGYLALLLGDFNQSNEYLIKAELFAKESSNRRLHALSIASKADLLSSLQLLNTSLSNYEESSRIASQIKEGYLLSYINLNQAVILRYLGNILKATEYLQIAHTFILQGTSQSELGTWHLETGFQQFAMNDYRSSRVSFLKSEAIFTKTEKPIELAKARMGLVLVSHEMSKLRLKQQHIEDWIASLVTLETNFPLLPEIHHHAMKITEALKHVPSNPAIDSLLSDHSNYQKQLPRLQKEIFPDRNSGSRTTESLEIFAFGKNQVLRDGEKIDSPEWIYQKTVRELFFYLLTLPRGATKEQIGLVFWPDSSPSQLTCQFKNVVYRMRRSLGRESILYDQETRTYSFNRYQSYSYDVENFLTFLQKAEKSNHDPEQIEYYQKAVDLYDHPYSPQIGGVWAEPVRQNLARKYEQALLSIAEYKLDQNHNKDCVRYCRKILRIESCNERAFQYCMKAYSNLNDRNGILRSYKECTENFKSIYGIEPSSATRLLFEDLIQ